MGLLSRLFGIPQQSRPTIPPVPLHPWRLAGRGRVEVVGESHYQSALAAGVSGRSTERGDAGLVVTAALVREPHNPYDRNAIRVEVWGHLVGHLPREAAAAYAPLLDELVRGGRLALVQGHVFGGGRRSYGIWLDLADASLGLEGLVPLNQPTGEVVLRPERTVTVTGEQAHQDVLRPYLPAGRSTATVFVSLGWCSVAKGKNAGQQVCEVRLDGRRIGELTTTMTTRYEPAVAESISAGRPVEAEARLFGDAEVAAELFLPRPQ